MPNEPDQIQVTISVQLYQQYYGSGQIRVERSFTIPSKDFLEIAALLGRFDALAKQIEKEEADNAKRKL